MISDTHTKIHVYTMEYKTDIKVLSLGQAWWLTLVIPALWEAEVNGSPEVRSLRLGWPTRQNPISTKNTKISPAWWHIPVIPDIQEAEAGESLEPSGQRLQWAEIMLLHSSLGNKNETPSQIKKKKKNEWMNEYIEVRIFITLINCILSCFFTNAKLIGRQHL